MTRGAGVLRSAASLAATEAELAGLATGLGPPGDDPEVEEVRNLLTVGQALLGAAAARQETRGNHTRTDFPDRDPAQRHRLVFG